jgi:hypothetical protein
VVTRAEARSTKFRNPDLFNKIIQLAESGLISVRAIGKHPEVVALNNNKTINYGGIQRIITNEKGPAFFKNLQKVKQPFKGEIRKGAEAKITNILRDYYKGDSTIKLTKKYFPNSKEAKAGRSATVLESVIKENLDPEKVKARPNIIGSNQFGDRKKQITDLKNFQTYLGKNVKKFTTKSLAESNLKNLSDNANTGNIRNFIFRTNVLRKLYNNPESIPEIKINEKVKEFINKLPAQDFIEEDLRALGYSEATIKKMNQVETAVQKMTTASTQLEHALPRALIRNLNLPKKFNLTAERTTNFLNKFKMQFDSQLTNAAMTYAESNQTAADYKKYINTVNKIRNKVKNLTGGYEIGYVDFDKNGNPIPKTNQMSFLRKGDAESVKAKGIENFKKNIQYHNALLKNFNKNPESADFFTLREEIEQSPRSFVEEKLKAEYVNATPAKKAAMEARIGCAEGCFIKTLNNQPEKVIRLYRGEEPARKTELYKATKGTPGMYEESLKGRFFFDNPADARYYAQRQGTLTGNVKSVDVPENMVNIGKKMADRRRGPNYSSEVILPKKFVGKETINIPQTAMARAGAVVEKLKYDNIKGAFVNVNKGDTVAPQAEIKQYAVDNPMEVKVGEPAKLPKPNKGVLKTVGKTLAAVGAPLPTALLDTYFISKQVEEGKSTAEIASNPLNWLGLATMSPLTKAAGLADKSGKLSSVLRLGLNPGTISGISRFAGLPGLALSTAVTAYDQYNKYKNQEGFIYKLFNKEES